MLENPQPTGKVKSSSRSALGKGLASLIPTAPVTPVASPEAASQGEGASLAEGVGPAPGPNKDRHPGISVVALTEIRVNPYQPRRDFDEAAIDELSQSIRVNGLIQPLVVRKMADHYELIAGERRLRASRKAGLTHVPIVIRKSTDKESLELALIENVQRENLNCVDEALAYFQLMQEFQLTQEQVAERVGKQRVTVANSLRLLKLPEGILDDLRAGRLTSGHGKALLGLDSVEDRLRLRAEILMHHWSVRETEAQIQARSKSKSNHSLGSQSVDSQEVAGGPRVGAWLQRQAALSQELTRQWFAKVELRGSEKKGKITLHYSSQGELERFLDSLSRAPGVVSRLAEEPGAAERET